jgi:hypothetical protein
MLSLTSALKGVGGQRHVPAALTRQIAPASFVLQPGWIPGPIWMAAENLASTRVSAPNLSGQSQLLSQPPKLNLKKEMSFANSARIFDASHQQLRFHRPFTRMWYIAAFEERDITIYINVHAMDCLDIRQD